MKILISGYYGFGNAGDEAVLKALKSGFFAHRVKVLTNRSWTKTFFEILNTDVLVSGGGTLFQNKTSRRSLFYYLTIILLAKLLKKRVVIFGQGFGPLKGFFSRLITKLILNQTNLITLRDRISFNEIHKLGVKKPPVCLTADPTGMLQVPKPRVGAGILHAEKIDFKKHLVGVILRPLPPEKTKIMAEAIKWLRGKHRLTPVFIPFQPTQDLEFCSEVMHQADISSKLILRYSKPLELLSVFSQLDLVIGMRLHSLIFALLNKVPMLGLSYDPKVASFMKWANQPFIDTRVLSLNEVQQRLEEILSNKHLIKRQLEHLRPLLQRKAALNFDLFFSSDRG